VRNLLFFIDTTWLPEQENVESADGAQVEDGEHPIAYTTGQRSAKNFAFQEYCQKEICANLGFAQTPKQMFNIHPKKNRQFQH
jgi:hypothetical protein